MHLVVTDQRESPRYTLAEAAHYLGMPASTLRSWVAGRTYPAGGDEQFWPPIVHRPESDSSRLSFANLVELFVLQTVRREYHVKMAEIREAVAVTESKYGIERFLLSEQLRVTEGNIFLDELDRITNVGKGEQQGLRVVLEPYLKRVLWDDHGFPIQLFPITRTWEEGRGPRVVTIHPSAAFGRPVVQSKWVRTATIAERFKAGESVAELVEDYELEVLEVEEAIRYEQVPLAA